jgi:hypothetical protein
MTKPPLERITITIPQPLLQAADELAHRLDRSRSWVLAEAVRRLVAEDEVAVAAPVGLPEVCRALGRTESRYLMTGITVDALQRSTAVPRRLELFIRRDLENAVRVLAGIEAAGYTQVKSWLPERLLDERVLHVPGQPPLILYSVLGGRRYDELEERADQVVLGGVRVLVMAERDLQQLEPILRRPVS